MVHIEQLGEHHFTAITDAGPEHDMTAQVTDVNKALLSVSKIVSKGCRVVFDEGNRYLENKLAGDWIPMEERNGMYFLKMWISREQKSLF